ncbi:homoserine dehydrogenase [Candidatus Omnitrophota bacterium]
MKSVNIGIIGLGTIGGGVVEAINSNGKLIYERTGVELAIKGMCDMDKKALDAATCAGAVKTSNADDLINDPDISIIVELIGGIDPAKDMILKAIGAKKHVVTANKALLSDSWQEIFKAAQEAGVVVNFEASVGGGIPVIKTLRESFVANNIDTVYGILNGTTNFILTMMDSERCSFSDALKVAQERGIAEKDPELDISGADSAHKLAILSLLAFGMVVSPEDIYTEGISAIDAQDLVNAHRWGYSIKLLAIAKDSKKGLELRVHPTLLKSEHLLSDVKGADNAIFIKGDLVGESLLFGKGAGRKPTSSSVIGDIVNIAKCSEDAYNMNFESSGKKLSEMAQMEIPFYFRFTAIDKPGVLAGISSILSENDISIANVSQEERNEGEIVPVVIMTHRAKEGNMRKAIEKIDGQNYIKDKTVVIRIEE